VRHRYLVVDGLGATRIKDAMRRQGVNVSVSDGAGSLVGYQRRGLTQTVRASVHYFNTEAEIERFAAILEGLNREA